MTNKIPEDDSRISPSERIAYEQDYKNAAKLFQKALQEHSKSTDMYQRNEFESVMNTMMQALNESARALKQEEHLSRQTKQIQKDYNAYQKSPDPTHQKQLDIDLEKAKRSV